MAISDQIDRFVANEPRLDAIVNGSDTTDVTLAGGSKVPSIRKLLRTIAAIPPASWTAAFAFAGFTKNNKGDPGANVMAIGLFTIAATLNIPNGTDVVRTAGFGVKGIGIADYAADATVDAAYAAANPRVSFVSNNGRGFKLIFNHFLDITAVGAVGDDATDDQPAFQAAVNLLKAKAGGMIFLPLGDFVLNSPVDCGDRLTGLNRVSFCGVAGVGFGGAYKAAGSRIVGTHAGNLFQWVSGDLISFDNITFDGFGCSAIRQLGDPFTDYLSNFHFRNCHFFTHLTECLYGNFIYLKCYDNSFGYFGTPSKDRVGNPQHRHIYCVGKNENTCNVNTLIGNRFYYAYGPASIYATNGSGWLIQQNNLEQNDTLPLLIRGIISLNIIKNWFELNRNTEFEIDIGAGTAVIDQSGLKIDDNQFVHGPAVVRVVMMRTANFDANGWSFDNNVGSNVPITNDFSKLRNQTGGLQFTDASGNNLGILGGGTFVRTNNEFTAEFTFVWPVSASTAHARISGMPFNAKNVVFGTVGTNAAGGAVVATDANAKTVAFFKPNTLDPVTMADLSGKLTYCRITYFV